MPSHLVQEEALNLLISRATICKAYRLGTHDIMGGAVQYAHKNYNCAAMHLCMYGCSLLLFHYHYSITQTDFNSGLNGTYKAFKLLTGD